MHFVTISTRDHLAQTAVLAESLARHRPGTICDCYLVEDEVRESDRFCDALRIRSISELDLREPRRFCFQYEPFELCCALKPAVIRKALDEGAARVVYLDADMYVTHAFDALLESAWTDADILLTPHLKNPERSVDDPLYLRVGAYNAGIVALQDSPATRRALAWWEARLNSMCYNDFAGGVLVDQSWLSLLPALFDGVGTLHAPGLNVGHWNVHELDVRATEQGIDVAPETPLALMHFSGFEAATLTSHPSVDQPAPSPILELCQIYDRERTAARARQTDASPCSFRSFADGSPILPEHRESIRRGLVDSADPFAERERIAAFVDGEGVASVMSERVGARIAELQRNWDGAAAEHERLRGEFAETLHRYRKQPLRMFLRDRWLMLQDKFGKRA